MPVIRDARGFHGRILDDPTLLNGERERVYAIWDGVAVKIGKTLWDPMQRLRDLQTGSSATLALVAFTSSCTERQVHRRLHRWRLRGEWFRLTNELLVEIATWDYVDCGVFRRLQQALASAAVVLS
jgi:hypothetical protein